MNECKECNGAEEVWLCMPAISEYAISNYGKVKRVIPNRRCNRHTGIAHDVDYILKPRPNFKGYLRYELNKKNYYIQRLLLLLFIGEPPIGTEAAHNDGDKTHNHVGNLRWSLPKANAQDKIAHGTSGKGSKNSMALLTEDQVLQIIKLYADGMSASQIASQFPVKKYYVSAIAVGRQWSHVISPFREKAKVIAQLNIRKASAKSNENRKVEANIRVNYE